MVRPIRVNSVAAARREIAIANGLVDNKVCAIDDTWSGLRLVYRLRDRPQP